MAANSIPVAGGPGQDENMSFTGNVHMLLLQ